MIQVIGSKLSQWDVGRSVRVSNDATHVHFANRGDSEAVIMEITNSEAKIPDYLLRTGKELLVYAVKNGVTLASKVFAVRGREKPENYIYEDDQRNYVYELVQAVEDAIAEAERVSEEMETQIAATAEAAKQANESAKQAEAAAVTAAESAVEAKEIAEQTEANLIDKLCPTINESGAIVACEPLSGYPLTVQAEDATKVYRCGKNLLKPIPKTETSKGITIECYEDGSFVVNGTATATVFFRVAVDFVVKEGVTYTLSGCTGGGHNKYQLVLEASNTIGLYNTSAPATGVAKATGMAYPRFYVYEGQTLSNMLIKPQLEVGSNATPYEQYRGTGEFAQGEAIPALDGVNTIWADSGDVTVTGKADPVAIMENLTNAIISLGGNV